MHQVLVDIATSPSLEFVAQLKRLSLGSATIARCLYKPNPGLVISFSQLVVAVNETRPYEVEWRRDENLPFQRSLVQPGQCLVHPSATPHTWRWTAAPKLILLGMEEGFVKQILAEAFALNTDHLETAVGTTDPVIEQMAQLWRTELDHGGLGGRVLLESLAAALIVHLYRRSVKVTRQINKLSGGLGLRRFQHVNDYIHSHLDQEISLSDLAQVAGIGIHHFCTAFRRTAGIPPHRYLILRRIHRAKELLMHSGQSIAEIAYAVGFSSQSQLTAHFRRLTGTTPAQFRRERRPGRS